RFDSVEVKQTAFRIDGVFLPAPTASDSTVYFVEVQFQPDKALYQRLFAEIALFLKYHPDTQNWRAVVLFAKQSLEPPESSAYVPFLALPNVSRIYLDAPPAYDDEPFGWGLMRLMVGAADRAPEQARRLIQSIVGKSAEQATLIELVQTKMVYKFPELRLEEIAAMLGMATQASQTRVFQDGRAEGRVEEGRVLIMKMLKRKLGEVPEALTLLIKTLPLERLEALGENLLDFETTTDLENWLQSNS
ncbi:MAG: DUF2887 domain-containing protein, partial [Cyanobacteria bacterium J06639_1]